MTNLDLNLLLVFEAVFDLQSASRAAERLNLTQSAISHALRRLRLAVGDPLFVRSGRQLIPTSRARAMAPGVRQGLASLRSSIVPPGFEPEISTRRFTVAAGSYVCSLVLPQFVKELRALAPKIAITVVPVTSDLLADLDEGTIDIALGAFRRIPQRLQLQALYHEEFVWIAASDNSVAASGATLEDMLATPHLVLTDRRSYEPVRSLVAEGPLERHLIASEILAAAGDSATPVPASVYDVHTAIALVSATDMVSVVPGRLARREQDRLGLRILDVDGTGPGIDISILSHRQNDADAGISWLKRQLLQLFSE